MAVTVNDNFLETIATRSPTSMSWAVDGASARVTYILQPEDFYAFVTQLIGGVYFDENYRLRRYIPLSLPEHPWLYASRIVEFQGLGIDGRATTDSFANFDAFWKLDKTIPKYAGVYRAYRITVQFDTRPYRILSDAQIDSYGVVNRDQWYIDTEAAGPITEQNTPFQDTFEWCRYITVDEMPKPELLTNNLGSWAYKTIDGVDNTAPKNNGALTTQDGSGSNLLMMKSEVRVKWWFVPYSIINNKNFYNAYNKVNKNRFLWYSSGTLLFKNIEINSYSSPYPIENINYTADPLTIQTSYLKNRYCDLTFVFERFDLNSTSIGTLPAADYLALNGKVRAGHNLMPFSGNLLYYYTETQAPANFNLGLPIYWSYDMRQLFSFDPYIF